MGVVVLHAGMPKAGSSSIQTWIKAHASELATTHDVVVLVARAHGPTRATSSVRFERYTAGSVNSGFFMRRYTALHGSARLVERLVDAISALADEHAVVLLSSEGFARPFYETDVLLLDGLNELGRHHEVRVAYYVRPQHLAIEASWRQWGYRRPDSPSRFVLKRGRKLNYLRTLEAVRDLGSRFSFEPRPFRADLLVGGHPASDFARTFLGLSVEPDSDQTWTNRGLSLDLVNALRVAPQDLRGSDPPSNAELERLRKLTEGWALDESENARRSRLVLQAHCHCVFERSNLQLARQLG